VPTAYAYSGVGLYGRGEAIKAAIMRETAVAVYQGFAAQCRKPNRANV
jgi:hypothetical protein